MGRRRLWLLFVAVVLTVGLTMIQTLREVQFAVEARDGKHSGSAWSSRGQRNMLQRLPHQISLSLRGASKETEVESEVVEHRFLESPAPTEETKLSTSQADTAADVAVDQQAGAVEVGSSDHSSAAADGQTELRSEGTGAAVGSTLNEGTAEGQPGQGGDSTLASSRDSTVRDSSAQLALTSNEGPEGGSDGGQQLGDMATSAGAAGDAQTTSAATQQGAQLVEGGGANDGSAAAGARPQGSADAAAQQGEVDSALGSTHSTAAAAGGRSCSQCVVERNQDSWGDILMWGAQHKVDSPDACCQACADFQPNTQTDMMDCNVWVYCEDRELCGEAYGECWLKHRPFPQMNVGARGPTVGWTTGYFLPEVPQVEQAVDPTEDRSYHVVVTAQGSPGMHWGSRIGYYWYKKVKGLCEREGNCQMGGFTRLLHDGTPDDLMDEIPTWVAQPLPPEHPDHGYVVLNRPYALLQWINEATIPEKYVLMSEPDHIWLKPMPNLMKGQRPAAFPFFYIEPWRKDFLNITRKFLGPLSREQAETVPPIGNAPTLMSVEDMRRAMPLFFNMSIAVHNDPEASKEWGWVQEMYAFALTLFKLGIDVDIHRWMMSQPPYDSEVEKFYILHYTYSNEFDKNGVISMDRPQESVWRWCKRDHYALPPPRNIPEPPPNVDNEMVRHLVRALNEATTVIPEWDQYAATGRAEALWDGVVG